MWIIFGCRDSQRQWAELKSTFPPSTVLLRVPTSYIGFGTTSDVEVVR